MSGNILRRLSVVGLAGTILACSESPAPTGVAPPARGSQPVPGPVSARPASAEPGSGRGVAQAPIELGSLTAPQLSFDDALLGLVPPSMSGDVADEMLAPVAPQDISAAFPASRFDGRTGNYVGFAPGFSVEVLATTRFLRAGNVLMPYTVAERRWVPYCFTDRRLGVYIYPVFVEVDGVLVPMYHVRRVLAASVPVVYLVSVPVVFVSPIDIILVPPPIIFVPVVVQPIRIIPIVQVVERIRVIEVIRPQVVLPTTIVREVRLRFGQRQRVTEDLVVRRLERLARAQERFDVRVRARIQEEERRRAEAQAGTAEAIRMREDAEARAREAEGRLRDRAELREDVERRVRERAQVREAAREENNRRARVRQERVDRIRAEEREKLQKDVAEREKAQKESADREREAKEATDRDRTARETAEREKAQAEAAERDKAQKEAVERDKAQKEAVERDKAQKEAVERDKAQQKAVERDKAKKEAVERDKAAQDATERSKTRKDRGAVERQRPGSGRGGGGGPQGGVIDRPPVGAGQETGGAPSAGAGRGKDRGGPQTIEAPEDRAAPEKPGAVQTEDATGTSREISPPDQADHAGKGRARGKGKG